MNESEALEWLEDSGLGFFPTFVPYQRSPIAVREPGRRDLRACWRVSFVQNATGRCHVMDYYQHFENWRLMPCGVLAITQFLPDPEVLRDLCFTRHHGAYIIGDPLAAEVLEQIVVEAYSLSFGLYEDWAREFGYDADSRAGEAEFRRQQQQSKAFRDLVGRKNFERLCDLEEHS